MKSAEDIRRPADGKRRKTDWKQLGFVLYELTQREIKRKYVRSYIGVFWSILSPVLHMLVMNMIFSFMFRRNIENYPLYYIIGHTFYSLFSVLTTSVLTTMEDNKLLLVRTRLPKGIFVLSKSLTAFVNFLYTLVPVIGMMLISQVTIGRKIILIIPDIMLLTVFSVGCGYILATLFVFFADIKYFYTVFLTLLVHLSAIMYPVQNLSQEMQKAILWNPVYCGISIARKLLMYNEWPEMKEWLILSGYAVVFFALGLFVFEKKKNKMMQKL